MKLDAALDEFGLLERRRHRGEMGGEGAAALAALREYLADYSGYQETTQITPRDMLDFLLEYYPSQEETEPNVALALLGAAAGFALWLVERGERNLAPFAAREEDLRRDLPRALNALALLKEHARREDLRTDLEATTENGDEAPASIGSGLDRMARLDEIAYAAAEEEYYRVEEVRRDRLVLSSSERAALGQEPVEAVMVPAAAAELLRPGDIIHAEIAPGPEGWELLEVFGIRPGGYE
jgi:hypothetical protein